VLSRAPPHVRPKAKHQPLASDWCSFACSSADASRQPNETNFLSQPSAKASRSAPRKNKETFAIMAQKNRKNKNRLPPFLPLLVDMLDAPATRALSHGAFRLYVALKRQYNPSATDRRNGRIYLSLRNAQQEIRSDKVQIARWYRELQHYGFIVMTERGRLGLDGTGKAPRWRLTEIGDPSAEDHMPTKDFLRWRGTKFRDRKKQNPVGEITHRVRGKSPTVLGGKSPTPKARTVGEIPPKGEARTVGEIPPKLSLTTRSGAKDDPDAPETTTTVVPFAAMREPRS
jgi:hypothetical protein